MKVINGDYVAEEGEVIYKGQKLGKRTIMETIQMGISMIRQEMKAIRQMTSYGEHLSGPEPQKVKGFVDFTILNARRTIQLLQELKFPIKATQKLQRR